MDEFEFGIWQTGNKDVVLIKIIYSKMNVHRMRIYVMSYLDSEGPTCRHALTRFWHCGDTVLGKWSRPEQMAWSLSKGMSPVTCRY